MLSKPHIYPTSLFEYFIDNLYMNLVGYPYDDVLHYFDVVKLFLTMSLMKYFFFI